MLGKLLLALYYSLKNNKFVKTENIMPTVQVKSNIELGLDEILNGISQLDTPELEQFLEQVSRLLARRKAQNLSKREAELLVRINQGIEAQKAERYRQLTDKLNEERITPEEHQELLSLIGHIETKDGERLEALIELAGLRRLALNELMGQLGLTPPGDAQN
ncbi:MAG: hypothetical protein KDD19_06875 [Phaeodactylibacter sp.]|nr:hypothetical protein [Phaeodactylibacter sp.]MCB9051081.1 STAS/SEC14 domain-containing protein [Lewinellaceae bacterium]